MSERVSGTGLAGVAAVPASTAAQEAAEERVPLATIFVYSLPSAGLAFSSLLISLYLMKFATDVLLVAPGVMGMLFGISRLWDAVSDPIAGFLSDRTRSRLGRRRSWMLASAPVLAITTLMLWSPPANLTGSALSVWMGVALFAFFTGTTIFSVPHESLGAELSRSYHERTRVFGVKKAVSLLGTFLALGAMALLVEAEDPRRTATIVVLAAALATAAFTLWAVVRLRERAEHQGRGGARLFRAFRDVLANGHARILLAVLALESFGTALLGIVTPFAMDYVLEMRNMTPVFVAIYFVPALAFIPVWIRLSRRVGKRNLWIFSMSMMSIAFCGLFFVGPGDVALVCALGVLAGIGGGCGQVVGPSIQADVIDFDEYRTGERKEGMYFAVWHFVRKGAYGLAAMLTGVLLSAVGYEPNAEQSESARLGLRVLFGFVPGGTFALGTLLFLRFRLNEAEHASIRRELEAR